MKESREYNLSEQQQNRQSCYTPKFETLVVCHGECALPALLLLVSRATVMCQVNFPDRSTAFARWGGVSLLCRDWQYVHL